MDIKVKIEKALYDALNAEDVRLDAEDGISGFVVARKFSAMSTLDRQKMIDEVLIRAGLTREERRKVAMIAGLTPEEYETFGPRIRVHKVRQLATGVEILLLGGVSEAEYVRHALDNQNGVKTTIPKEVPGAVGVLMSFRAKGAAATPLTKQKALTVLKQDQHIEVMPSA